MTALKLAWPYFPAWDRSSPIADCSRFEERLASAQALAASLDGEAHAEVDPTAAAIRASVLSKLWTDCDREVLLRLKAPFVSKFDGRQIWDVMLCLRLRWGDMDCFHWLNKAENDSLFTVSTSTPPGYFLPEEVSAGRVKTADLLFSFSLPRSPNPEAVFLAMFNAAEYAQKRLGGNLEDSSGGTPNKEAFLAAIKDEVQVLRSHGFEPGSSASLQFF